MFQNTASMLVTVTGTTEAKEIRKGTPTRYPNVRRHRGDDAIAMTMGGKKVAAWVTAGDTSKQLALHTIDANGKLVTIPLRLP